MRLFMGALTRFLTSAKTSWIILVITALAATALFALAGSEESETAPSVGLPSSAESVKVDQLLEEFPSADATSALLVFASEDGVLDEKTLSLIDQKAFGDLAALALHGAVPPAQVSDDGTVALVVVPLEPEPDVAEQTARAQEIRDVAAADLEGVRVYLTGAEGFEVDIAAVFDGADFTLLLTTVIVVAVVLLITYRSPWLWIVPLVVIGLADALAGIVARQVASAVGIQLDASITGILSVLVSFGPGRCRRCDRGCD
ncbi:MMPL family transporter [Microbacterium maritypicum]|uniref:MMPL family transporter n=2 Tax=Microbacterium maritypicum TaxID=33918 RepID=UPI0022E17C00|nr:MMPL family transporter [Microbacterium liquefaciens]